MKTHQVGAATIAAMCLLLASTRSQTVQLTNPNVRSEGHFFVRDYVLYSDAVVVNFRSNVMRTPKGSQVATMNQVGPEYADVRGQLETLAMRYGGIRIKKQVPNAAWGEVTRTNRRSGAPVQIRDLSQLFILILGSPADIDSLVGALKKIPSVEYAHQPLSIISFADPNDPEFEEGNQWYLTAIDASNAWRITHGSSNVSIAIIDEGVKRNHVDLQGKIIGGDSIEGQHGTWVAGIAAGKTDNETGIASLGWNTKLYTYGDGTSQPMWDWSTIADEISTAAEICDIINLSWGCFKYATLQDVMTRMPNCTDPEKWVGAMFPAFYGEIDAAIDNAVSEGVVCVVAAGNSTKNNPPPGQDPEDCDADIPPYVSYPADNDATIAVSGTELVTGTEQFRDNYNYGAFVDVAAPAIQIRTTEIAGGYAYVNGTSFSAPQVCALVSLILAVNSSLTPSQVRDILTSTADKIDASNHPYDQNGWNECLGYGRINAYKALSKTNGAPSGPTNLTITNTSSTPIHLSWTQNSEPDLASYEVWRKSNSGSWQLIGSPTTNSYTDNDYYWMGTWGNESLQYKVRAIDAAGLLSDYSSTVSITGEPNEDWGNNPEQSAFQATLVPEEYGLDKNFPNPFNPTTSMNYALPTTSRISLTIYDMLGRKIAVLAQGIQAAGYHTVRFNGSHFPSGMYVCRFTATPLNDEKLPFAETRKMVLAK